MKTPTAAPSYHPRVNDSGNPVVIKHPSTPTPPASWTDPAAVAVFVPGGPVPAELNGIPVASWGDAPTTDAGWAQVEGLNPDLAESPMKVTPGLKASAGVVLVEPDGRVWLVHPTNGFGGYRATWPKGRVEGGLSLQGTACREAWEESGFKVRITGLLGDFLRTTSVTRYYLAERTGGSPSEAGWETQGCTLAPLDALPELLNGAADKPVLAALKARLAPEGK